MFRFDDFPEIKLAHEKFQDLDSKCSTLSIKLTRSWGTIGEKKAQKLYSESAESLNTFQNNVYVKIIFNTFLKTKPEIRHLYNNMQYRWNELVGESYEKLTEREKVLLIGLVEDTGTSYRLPPEYYDDRDEREERDAKIWEKHWKKKIFNHYKKTRGIILHGDQQDEIYQRALKRKEAGIVDWLNVDKYEK